MLPSWQTSTRSTDVTRTVAICETMGVGPSEQGDGRSPPAYSALPYVQAVAHHNGLLMFSVNEENMTLKLTLTRSSSLSLGETEC